MSSSKSASSRYADERARSKRTNVSVACEPCRLAKRKCDPDRPCRPCTVRSIDCVSVSQSGDGRRQRHSMAELAARIDALYDIVGLEGGKDSVAAALQAIQTDAFGAEIARMQGSRQDTPGTWPRSSYSDVGENLDYPDQGESYVGSDVGSPAGGLELSAVVNLDEGNGLPGYLGKLSPATWLQRAHKHVSDIQATQEVEPLGQVLSTMGLNYYMDNEDVLAVNEDYIDAQGLPSWQAALILAEAYFCALRGAYHFVQCDTFYQRLKDTYEQRGSSRTWGDRRFLSLANMIWALGSWWLAQTDIRDQAVIPHGLLLIDSHLTYYARARSLGLDHRVQIDHPCLDMVEGMAILAIYLFVNGSVQRAWITAGQAIRCGIALGLHLQPEPRLVSHAELRRRSRTWYSMYRLESLLSQITGRPGCLRYSYSTIPSSIIPQEILMPDDEHLTPLAEAATAWQEFLGQNEQLSLLKRPTASTYQSGASSSQQTSEDQFVAAIDLCSIGDKIANSLYLSPNDLTWADVQNTVRAFEAEIAEWQEALPVNLKVDSVGMASLSPSHIDLHMYHNSLKVVLYRPFLGDIRIIDQSPTSAAYNQLCARACINAAIRNTDFLPDHSSAQEMFRKLPWWTLLHYICQIGSVFLIELSLDTQHMKEQEHELLMALSRTLACLRNLAPSSKSAYRAWNILQVLTNKVLAHKGGAGGLPIGIGAAIATKLANWAENDELDLQETLSSM